MTNLCHKEVRRIAKEMAGAAYENFAKNDQFYKTFPNQNKFIARHWKNFIGIARNTLLYMLGNPSYSDVMKADIYEIYVKDRMLQDVRSIPAAEAMDFPVMPIQGSA